jgi:hypothetical protein
MSEPWANPDYTKMLKIVLEMGFNVAIYTTIYGMAPNDAKLVVKLIERYNNQIVTICLHLPDAKKI